jgi:DeoR/GlpR family transcriptional regulator of sugar metabolism
MMGSTNRRRSMIVEELERQQLIKVADLSEHLGVSEVSIRRDLQRLEELGLLKRVHGGAVATSNAPLGESFSAKIRAQAEKKERIGAAAAKMICKGDHLILDSGTTPLQVAKHISAELLDSGNLTVITASLPIVHELGRRKGVHLILLGGIYLPEYEVVAGPQTIEHLKGLHADKMFLGTDGMTFSQGLTTANVLEAEVDRAMVAASTEVIVVSDSSKIGGIGLATIMPLARIHKLITDAGASPDFVATLQDQGVQVLLV